MKKSHLWLGALVFSVLSFFAFAEPMPPLTGTTEISFVDFIRQLFELANGWKTLTAWACATAVLKVLVDATKTQFLGSLFDKLGPVGKRLLPLVFSALMVGTTAAAAGAALPNALIAIVTSGAGSMLLYELLSAISGKATA
jgi:hypothetical protein